MPRNDSFGVKSHTAWRSSRVVPCAIPYTTIQKHQTKCTILWIGMFLQPFQMDVEEKKQRWVVSSTISSSFLWYFSQLAIFFSQSKNITFRNLLCFSFAIKLYFQGIPDKAPEYQNVCQIEYQKICQIEYQKIYQIICQKIYQKIYQIKYQIKY